MKGLHVMRWLVGVVSVATIVGVGALIAAPARATTLHAAPQQVLMYVFRGHINGKPGVPGPDRKGHDTFVPSTFAVKVGVPVKVTVINYDEGAHSLVAPDLGLSVTIKPGKEPKGQSAKDKETAKDEIGEGVQPVTTTFTFTPTKAGVYRWYCSLPCDAGQGYWAMGMGYSGPGKEGSMAGFIVVLAGA
jgi:plastocyanin